METMLDFLQTNWQELIFKAWEHLYISMIAVFLGIIVAVPLGIMLTRMKRSASIIIGIANIMQTLPSLAVFAFFIPFLGVGKTPAIIALFFYSVLPILRNTYTGIKGVNENLLESGRGIGMSSWERIRLVEFPLALSVIMAGIRTASVYLIGWATLASGLRKLGARGSPWLQKHILILQRTVAAAVKAAQATLSDGISGTAGHPAAVDL